MHEVGCGNCIMSQMWHPVLISLFVNRLNIKQDMTKNVVNGYFIAAVSFAIQVCYIAWARYIAQAC